ncbi:hypothetical protein Efla_006289 [Eimeria flavescens]
MIRQHSIRWAALTLSSAGLVYPRAYTCGAWRTAGYRGVFCEGSLLFPDRSRCPLLRLPTPPWPSVAAAGCCPQHSIGASLQQTRQARRAARAPGRSPRAACQPPSRAAEGEEQQQQQQQQQQERQEEEGEAEGRPISQQQDEEVADDGLPPAARRAASESTSFQGKALWASYREEVSRCIANQQVPPAAAALLAAAFARADELTAPLAAAVGTQFAAALKAARRRAVGSPPLLEDWGQPSADEALRPSAAAVAVNFSAVATLLVAKRDAGLLTSPSVAPVAAALQQELLLCVQAQLDSLTFEQVRRMLLLLGVTAGSLSLQVGEARSLFAAAKKHLRRLQKKGHSKEGADVRDSLALLWPLAVISAALKLTPPPQEAAGRSCQTGRAAASDSSSSSSSSSSSVSSEEVNVVLRDRDILLELLKRDVFVALSSRLPCAPLDLALGFAGLQRLGQGHAAEFVLSAFSSAAAAAPREELCRLAHEVFLMGSQPPAFWRAFGRVVAASLSQKEQQQGQPAGSRLAKEEAHERELLKWLRFCNSS